MIIQEGIGLRERTLELERRNDVLKTQMAETGPEMVGLRHGLMEAKEMLVEAQVELLKVAREKEDLQKAGLELNNRNHELVIQLTEVRAECQSAARKHTTLTDALQTEVFELIKRNGDLQVQLEGLRMKRTAIAHREAIISCERQIESMRERAQKDREDLESQNHRYKDKIVELEDKLSEALRRVALSCPWCSAGGSNSFNSMVPLCGTDQFVGNSSGHKGAFSAPERLI